MDKNDQPNLGDQIKNIVQDALDNIELDKLNANISQTVNKAVEDVHSQVSKGQNKMAEQAQKMKESRRIPDYIASKQDDFNSKYQIRVHNKRNQATSYKAPAYDIVPISKSPAGRISGILYTIFGFIGVGVLGILLLIFALTSVFTGATYALGAALSFIVPMFCISVMMTYRGIVLRSRVGRFRRYVRLIHGRTYCAIKELSTNIGKSDRYVVKDLYKMIQVGMFPEGRIDDARTCLMLNNDAYQQYSRAQIALKTRQEEEQQRLLNSKKNKEVVTPISSLPKEVRGILEEGRNYINCIRQANEVVLGEEVTTKLYRLETITTKILSQVEKHPEQIGEIRKFMDYYLPTTLKLVTAYREFDSQPVQGENITKSKLEIVKTLDTINLAFETLFDSLFEDVAMDISTDISVLQTMLAQEGLTEKDFN